MGSVTVGQMDYLIGFNYRTEHGEPARTDETLDSARIGCTGGTPCLIFGTRKGNRVLRLLRDVSDPAAVCHLKRPPVPCSAATE